jgi:hypothetical protein
MAQRQVISPATFRPLMDRNEPDKGSSLNHFNKTPYCVQLSVDCGNLRRAGSVHVGDTLVIEKTFLGLCSEEWWEIYEAENPLAEGLRKISSVIFRRRSSDRRTKARTFEGRFQSY